MGKRGSATEKVHCRKFAVRLRSESWAAFEVGVRRGLFYFPWSTALWKFEEDTQIDDSVSMNFSDCTNSRTANGFLRCCHASTCTHSNISSNVASEMPIQLRRLFGNQCASAIRGGQCDIDGGH